MFMNASLIMIISICSAKPTSANEIHHKIGYGYQYVHNLLSSLKKLGLIEKYERRGRNVLYTTTPSGNEILKKIGFRVIFDD